ncbi:MAG: hypothetical protein K8R58_00240 [Bacteroidales bacterium]|nr:hypothetical protein [Bacteroidales bacterium]
MKNLFTLSLLLLTITTSVFCQAPQAFKYQAVVRDNAGEILQNQAVGIRISIHNFIASGFIVYQETFADTTNQFGLVNLQIGTGTPTIGTFTGIDWGSYSKFLETEIDPTGGSNYVSMGTSKLLSVPYALYSENTANTDDADADPGNEFQTIVKVDSLVTLSDIGGSFVDETEDADADPGNEFQTIIKVDSLVTLSDIGGSFVDEIEDADADTTNELQTLSIAGNDLSISDGNTITLPDTSDNLGNHTATQNIKLSNNWISNHGENDGIYIDSTANIGVGTSSPGARLEVAGHIWQTGIGGSVFIGEQAGANDDSTDNKNIFIGKYAGYNNTEGFYNSFIGYQTGQANISGTHNNFIGYRNGQANTSGWGNTLLGCFAGYDNTTGTENIFLGVSSGVNNVDGNRNVYIGNNSGLNCTGSDNVFIGHNAGYNETGSDKLYISNSSTSHPLIYGEFDNGILVINGKVGIGTTTPAFRLDVKSSGYADGMSVTSSDEDLLFRVRENSNGSSGVYIMDQNGSTGIYFNGSSNSYFNAGNVGIGTTNPGASLDVAGHIWQTGTGKSVFVGERAGENDDLSDNRNVFIGYYSGIDNTTGERNNASGYAHMRQLKT